MRKRALATSSGGDGLAAYDFEGGQVRALPLDGDPWFVAKDVAGALGYANTRKAVRDHCKASRPVGGNVSFLPPLDPKTIIIPERDVYRLMMRSKLPSAERFEELVFGEILPAIRKTGRYETPGAAVLGSSPPAPPPPPVLEGLPGCRGSLTLGDAARALGQRPHAFSRRLEFEGWIYKRAGLKHWLGHSVKVDGGFLEHRFTPIVTGNDARLMATQVRVTAKGLTRLAEMLGAIVEPVR